MKSQPSPRHWLLKTEPETFSFTDLVKDKKTNWNGVRNFQARNFLREMAPGDVTLIYHSGKEKSVVGLAKVTRAAFAEKDPEGGDWSQVEIGNPQAMKESLTLADMKTDATLKDMMFIRQSRLSVSPVTPSEFARILKRGGISK